MTELTGAPERRAWSPTMVFAGAAGIGAIVAVAAGVYGGVHDATSEPTMEWFFTSTLHFKAWLTTVAVVLAIGQVFGGLWMFGKLPLGPAPSWVGPGHRIAGSLALLASLPVAYHCLWSLGFNPEPGGGRRFWHSLFGCLFYGTFATKVLAVRSHRMPGWALPIVGGLLFTILVLLWLTSSLWFFRNIGVEF
jgi:hypothetical protein